MRKELTYDDAIAISKLSQVEIAVPFLDITSNFFGQKILVTGGGKTSANVTLQGTLPEYERAGTEVVQEGRFFSQFENDMREEVCVIGAQVADDFFHYGSAVDKTIEIAGREFRVVGVLEKREAFLGDSDQNNGIYVPFDVARKIKPNEDDIFILAVAREGRMEEAKDQITDLLRVRRQVPFGQKDNFGDGHFRVNSRAVSRDHCGSCHCYGRNLVRGFDGRRHRRDEHHACVSYRTHPRDWNPESHWSKATRHSLAIPD